MHPHRHWNSRPVPRPSPLRNVFHTPDNRSDLVVSNETQKIIEDCGHNGPFVENLVCAFPLTDHQFAGILGRINQRLTLFNYDSRTRWEVQLEAIFNKDEWSGLMKFKSMQPIYVAQQPMSRGCKIRFLRQI